MEILWHGQSCFEIRIPSNQVDKKTILIDPFSENIGLKFPSLTTDILLITHDHPDHNNIKATKGKPFLIDGPGEYEVKGAFIRGIAGSHGFFEKKDLGKITIYTLEIENMRICHLSDLGQKELTPEQLEVIGEIDILMVPTGGSYTIDGEMAQKIVNQIEPKIVIPMHYELPKLKVKLDKVEIFLKAMGQGEIKAQSVLKIKKQGLPVERKIVVLKP